VANPHFGNLGDVWKHIALAEILARERPSQYWETHAGSASYPLSHSPGRDYGVYHLLASGGRSSVLSQSTYYKELTRLQSERHTPIYPGSGLLALRILGNSASYAFSDLDESSVRSLSGAAAALGLGQHVRIAVRDGLAAVRDMSKDYRGDPADVFVHIDPFDPQAETEQGLSALSLAAELSVRGFKLLYWYGYDLPDERTWPWAILRAPGQPQWCGDLIVRSNLTRDTPMSLSDIGPLVGCGVVTSNLKVSTTSALQSLANGLVSLYDDATTPTTGGNGALDFREIVSASGKLDC
jgi:23S rRNA (adenine2030-N6)-methyltransferase